MSSKLYFTHFTLLVILILRCCFVGSKAKMESDRLIVSVGKKAPQETGIKVKNHSSSLSLAHRRDFKQLLQGITGEGPLRLPDINFKEFAGFQIVLLNKVGLGQSDTLCSVWHTFCQRRGKTQRVQCLVGFFLTRCVCRM